MPTFSEASKTIHDTFTSNFHAARPDVPIGFRNVTNLMKSDGTLTDKAQDSNGSLTPWVRLAPQNGSARQVTMGGKRRWRQTGVVIVQIFTPANSGHDKINQLADDIASVFRGMTIDGVRFKAPNAPNYVGPDGQWHQANVTTEFDFDLFA